MRQNKRNWRFCEFGFWFQFCSVLDKNLLRSTKLISHQTFLVIPTFRQQLRSLSVRLQDLSPQRRRHDVNGATVLPLFTARFKITTHWSHFVRLMYRELCLTEHQLLWFKAFWIHSVCWRPSGSACTASDSLVAAAGRSDSAGTRASLDIVSSVSQMKMENRTWCFLWALT